MMLATIVRLYKDDECFTANLELDDRGYALTLCIGGRRVSSQVVTDVAEALDEGERQAQQLASRGWTETRDDGIREVAAA